ncbi:EAL domain-containing protein [Pseudoalteromonas denitrificans]|uniref:PAS domain S-box-containing protein/diguanylate cyclase (GGDEF) domain-containing protein n=1 Tax=Pseudoalteromonas denitrificans DSM 6059 TaxID=1123010 RepID=A0A1I1NYI5_9GAMM|nr:EAL domain-containing protein [Pseudoalteromonas denitrificans]SFD02659.1 PAS domain S-box-containing protein/diguanylate cyclase (GGDEF) domain-containing protein [Pseudoalteromonas denitrificans DSM 6059]
MVCKNRSEYYRFTLRFFTLLYLFFFSFQLFAQIPKTISFSSLDNQFSSDIAQDARGDFWLTTQSGLYRFDGLDSQKISSETVKGLRGYKFKDVLVNKNNIWLNSDAGIELIDIQSQTSQLVTSQIAEQLHLDKNNRLWYIHLGKLKKYDGKQVSSILPSSAVGKVIHFLLLAEQKMWIINQKNQLILFDLPTKKIINTIQLTQATLALKQNSQGTIWLLNNDFKLQFIQQGSLLDYQPLKNEFIFRFATSTDGYIYFYNQKGAFIHDTYSQTTRIIQETDKHSLRNIYLDRKKGLWLQLQNGDWLNSSSSVVRKYNVDESIKVSLDTLRSKVPNLEQVININKQNWLGINSTGLYLKTNNHDAFQLSDMQNIKTIYYDNAELLWLSDDIFLYSFDLLTKKIIDTFSIKNIKAITSFNNDYLLTATHKRLYLIAPHHKKVIIKKNENMGLIYDIFYDQNIETLWLATQTGLWQAKQNNQLWSFKHITPGKITYIHNVKSEYLWLIKNDILTLFNSDTKEFIYHNPIQISSPRNQLIKLKNTLIFNHEMIAFEDNKIHTSNSTLKVSSLSYNKENKKNKVVLFPSQKIYLPSTTKTIYIKISEQLGTLNKNFSFEYRFLSQPDWFPLGKGSSTLTLSQLPSGIHVIQFRNVKYPLKKHTELSLVIATPPLSNWWYLIILIVLFGFGFCIFKFNVQPKQKQDTLTLALLKQTKEAIWIANHDFEIKQVNKIFTQITGFDEQEVINKNPTIYSSKGRNKKLEQLIQQELVDNEYWSGEVWSCRKNGEEYSLDLSITKVNKNKKNQAPNYQYVGMFSDITIRKRNERELRLLATRDPITQLPNRTLFIEHLEKAIHSCNETFPTFALLFIDLDNFHKINDSLGHTQGDLFLKQIGLRLKSNLEKGFTIARLGGDEFAVLIPPYLYSGMTLFYAKRVADNILSLCKSPFTLEGIDISITTSIGISRYPDNGINCEMLMRSADTALVHAKQNGKNSFQFYDKSQTQTTPELLSKEYKLSQGIENEELILFYQAKYDTSLNRVVGFEALARWPQVDGTMISPGEFIPIAESNGMIVTLTLNLFKQACKQLQFWKQHIDINGRIAINLSAKHFQKIDLVKDLTHCLASFNISGRAIELEITESAMMDNPDFALKQMLKLKELGFSIALDDFGTGHSSLSYLKKFPIDKLKIDRSFILDITTSEQDRNITSTIIQLAKYLNIEVVAEGVETKEQVYLLHIMGCKVIQGYYFSRPIPADKVINLINQPTKIQSS